MIFITRSQEVNAIDNVKIQTYSEYDRVFRYIQNRNSYNIVKDKSGWIELNVDNSNPVQSAGYGDFSITTNRVQLQLTQLKDNDGLDFEVKFGFYSEASKVTAKAELIFTWSTKNGNKLSLYDVTLFETCDEPNDSALLSSIPSESTVDLSTDYLLETSEGQKGKFSTETSGQCPRVWTSFTNNRAAIKKFKIFLENKETAKKLSDHYTVSYRILTACQGGQYLDNNNDGTCKDCQTDYYGAGGWLESCTKCPDKKGVEAGKGKTESDCTWKPCSKGQYLDQTNGCQNCPKDQWSDGGLVASCTNCPDGKEVAEGAGTSASSCTWKACLAGQFLDQSTGCQDCPKDHWSAAGNTAASCTACPTGKEVAAGQGKQKSDCTWKACSKGQYLDQTTGCQNCPKNQWSAGGIVTSCTNCPANKGVAEGAGTSQDSCTWNPCVAGQYLDQAEGCKNCPANHWSAAGNTEASCTACTTGKEVAAGQGKQESDCTWKPCVGGQYLDQAKGCLNCEAGSYSAGGTVNTCTPCLKNQYSGDGATQCTNCPAKTYVSAGKGTKEDDCKEDIVTWTVEKLILVREKAEAMENGNSEGLLVVTTNNGAESLNVTFCNEGYSNATAKTVCSRLGFGDGQYGSNPQNFEYVSESMLKKKSMPVLSVDSCSTKYNYTDVTDDCMDKMKKNSCGHDDTVWIKCAEVVDDGGGSSSTKVSATTILVIFNICFSLIW